MGLSKNVSGWYDATPSVDTKVIYVADDGNDGTGTVYDYDDVLIGSDPFAPTGAVAPFLTLAAAEAELRTGYPDWILLKKGDTWTDEKLGSVVYQGRSATERVVLGAYGTGARPVIEVENSERGWSLKSASSRNVFGTGIEFYAYASDPDNGSFGSSDHGDACIDMTDEETGPNAARANFLFQDLEISFFYIGISIGSVNHNGPYATDVVIWRNIIHHNYADASNGCGIYAKNVDSLVVEENVLHHNGWVVDRDAGYGGGAGNADGLSHNHYMQNKCPTEVGNTRDERLYSTFSRNISMHAACSAFKMRAGGVANNNLIIQCADMEFGKGEDNSTVRPSGVYVDVKNNVFEKPIGTSTGTPQAVVMYCDWIGVGNITGNLNYNAFPIASYVYAINYYGAGPYSHVVNYSYNVTYNSARGVPNTNGDYTIQGDDTDLTEEWNIYSNPTAPSNDYIITGTNREDVDVSFPDVTRSTASYNSTVCGGAETDAAFVTACLAQSRDSYDTRYTAPVVNDWIRAGFDMPAVSSVQTRVRIRARARVV